MEFAGGLFSLIGKLIQITIDLKERNDIKTLNKIMGV